MRDHLGGDKPLCPTIPRKLCIKIWIERKHFFSVVCHGRDGQLCKSILSCKKTTVCYVLSFPFLPPTHPQQCQGNEVVLTPTALIFQLLVCTDFIVLNSWAPTLSTTPCRSHQQGNPAAWCIYTAEPVSASEDLGRPKRPALQSGWYLLDESTG